MKMDEEAIISVASYRNNIPRKSLDYKTSLGSIYGKYVSLSNLT